MNTHLYKIISGDDPQELSIKVELELTNGFEPLGAPFVVASAEATVFYQAVLYKGTDLNSSGEDPRPPFTR